MYNIFKLLKFEVAFQQKKNSELAFIQFYKENIDLYAKGGRVKTFLTRGK